MRVFIALCSESPGLPPLLPPLFWIWALVLLPGCMSFIPLIRCHETSPLAYACYLSLSLKVVLLLPLSSHTNTNIYNTTLVRQKHRMSCSKYWNTWFSKVWTVLLKLSWRINSLSCNMCILRFQLLCKIIWGVCFVLSDMFSFHWTWYLEH